MMLAKSLVSCWLHALVYPNELPMFEMDIDWDYMKYKKSVVLYFTFL